MPRYAVRGTHRGILYVGSSLQAALKTLQRDIYVCRIEHQGPSDARLCCDGALVATELRADGTLGVAPKRPRVELPPSEMPRK